MKRSFLCLAAVGCLLCVSALTAHTRTWTTSRGSTMEAELISVEGERVKLKAENGRDMVVPISRLSKEDQDFIAQWQAGGGAQEEEPAEAEDLVAQQFRGVLVQMKDGELVDYTLPEDKKYYVLYFADAPVRYSDNQRPLGTPDKFTPKLAEFYTTTNPEGKADYELILIHSAGKNEQLQDFLTLTNSTFPLVKMGRRGNIDIARNYSDRKEPYILVLDPQKNVVLESGQMSVEDVLTKLKQEFRK